MLEWLLARVNGVFEGLVVLAALGIGSKLKGRVERFRETHQPLLKLKVAAMYLTTRNERPALAAGLALSPGFVVKPLTSVPAPDRFDTAPAGGPSIYGEPNVFTRVSSDPIVGFDLEDFVARLEKTPRSDLESLVFEYRPVGTEETTISEEPGIGRNDPCWCGSRMKFKRCHGA